MHRDALHWKRKGVLCVSACSITVEQDCVACICEGVLKTVANSNDDLDMEKKFQRKVVCAGEKYLDRIVSAMSKAERILSMCEIGYEIHISMNFSLKFGGIIPILFNIKPA